MKPAAVANEVAAPSADAPVEITGRLPAIADNEVKDANYYRARGALAYRSGDLSLALVDYDLAINLDPNFSDAYIDRAIVWHRMGDLKHAFADIAQAKRIDNARPGQDRPLSVGQR
jgi:tetratricopeptide (TPR) repeat protein